MRRYGLPLMLAAIGMILMLVGVVLVRVDRPAPEQVLVYQDQNGLYGIAPEKNWVRLLSPRGNHDTLQVHTSSDNRWVYYVDWKTYVSPQGAINRVATTGGDAQKVGETSDINSILLAPDQSWMIYEMQETSGRRHYVASDLDGTEFVILTKQLQDRWQISSDYPPQPYRFFTLDSQWLVFTVMSSTGKINIMRVDRNGQSLAAIAADLTGPVSLGGIDPNDANWFFAEIGYQLYRLRLDGTDLQQLPAPQSTMLDMGDWWQPIGPQEMTAPNGEWSAKIISDETTGGLEIQLVTTDSLTNIASFPPEGHNIPLGSHTEAYIVGFTPDSQWLFYRRWDHEQSYPLYQVRRDGQEHQRVDLPLNEDDSAKMAYERIDWLEIRESAWMWRGIVILGGGVAVWGCLLGLRRAQRMRR